MKTILLTNNPLLKNFNNFDGELIFLENKLFLDVLLEARDLIHQGHKLLTHPLSSSIKPDETPYKSIAVSFSKETLDLISLQIIEDSIETVKKFSANRKKRKFPEKILKDFQLIDSDIIKNSMEELWKKSMT